MIDQSVKTAEQVSALVDGQLHGDEFAQVLADLETSGVARAQWDVYHVLGDVLRSNQVSACAHDTEFVERLRQRLTENPTELAPVNAVPIRAGGQTHLKSESANDRSWRRLASFAAVVLLGVLAWQGLQWANSSDLVASPQLAQKNVTTPNQAASVVTVIPPEARVQEQALIQVDASSGEAQVPDAQLMIRDPQLDALLAAHRQFGGTSALQMPAGFLRNATFAEGGR